MKPTASSTLPRAFATPDTAPVTPDAAKDTDAPPNPWGDYCHPEKEGAFLRRLVHDTVDTAIASGMTRLDLSFASNDAVSALPAAAVVPLAQGITQVVLPNDMSDLPPWLHSLVALMEIDLPAFAGDTLNVTAWALDLLRLPAATALRTVHASEGTIVQCPLSRIGWKVCVHYYRDGERTRSGAASARVYWKHPTLAYVNYNNQLLMDSGKRAVCRHLAAWRGITGQQREKQNAAGIPCDKNGMYEVLRQCREEGTPLAGNWEHTWREVHANQRTIMVGSNLFGSVIADALRALADSGRGRSFFLMETLTHVMLLELVCKEGRDFAVTLYDPNRSLTHARLRLNAPDDMKRERIETLLDPRTDYFNALPPVAFLFSLDEPRTQRSPSAELHLTESEMHSPLPLLLSTHEGLTDVATGLFDYLKERSDEVDWNAIFSSFSVGNSVVHHAVQNGNIRFFRQQLDHIITLSNSGEITFAILPALLTQTYLDRDKVPTTLMHLLVTDACCPLLEILADALLSTGAARLGASSMLSRILLAADSGLPSPLRTAIARQDHRAVNVFSATVARFYRAGRLDAQSLERVLLDFDPHGQPALARIFEARLSGLLHDLLSPWTTMRQLPPTTVQRLFGGLDWQSLPVMRAAYASGQAPMLRAYADVLVLAIRGGALDALEATCRLFACTPGETLEQRLAGAVLPQDQWVPGWPHINVQIMLRAVLRTPAFTQNLPHATRARLAAALDPRFDDTESASSDTRNDDDSLASDTESDDSGLSDGEG